MMKRKTKVDHLKLFKPLYNKSYQENMQSSLKYILTVASCLAVMPVDGFREQTRKLRFRWTSGKTFQTIVTIMLCAINVVMITTQSVKNDKGILSYEVVIWSVRSLVCLVLFFKLSMKWPELMRNWSEVDILMLNMGPVPRLKQRFFCTCLIFLTLGLVEHGMFLYYAFLDVHKYTTGFGNTIRQFFLENYEDIFNTIEYSHFLGLIVEYLAIVNTFVWQYTNVFIILLSSSLALRYRQITNTLKNSQNFNETHWRNLRKTYNRLSLLCNNVNECMSEIIIASFAGNIYLLAITVFQAFGLQKPYFYYNMIFIAIHFVAVCMYASWVHEEGLSSLPALARIPTKNYCHENERLLNQVSSRSVGIYGGRLFLITRGLILNVISIIVTLQLIFIQFNTKVSSHIKVS